MTFTIVICPGAWPLVEFFEPLKQAFQAKNHTAICRIPSSYPDVIPHTLPSVNPDAKYLRSHVLEPLIDEGRDIVLYAHSYGGVYGPAALEGLSKKERQAKGLEGGVIGVILNAAFIAPKGTTAMAAMRVDPMSLPEWIRYDEYNDLVALDGQSAKAMLFHDLPDEEAERLAGVLPKQPYACFATAAHWDPYHDANFRGTLGYIFTEADRIVSLEAQRISVQMASIDEMRLLKGSSHSPHIERPVELADMILELVAAITEK